MHLFSFGSNKAGMENCDKEKQARIVHEMSKNSAYLKQAEKQDKVTDAKVDALKKSFEVNDEVLLSNIKQRALSKYMEIEKFRSFSRICCVLDMDMFFAAVEIRDQPDLKDLPVAVGGDMMISTANYVARQYGVRSAMPGFIAKKLCPQLVFVPCNFDKYEVVSNQIKTIIGEYDPNFYSHSLDEVYFDLSSAAIRRTQESEPEVAGVSYTLGKRMRSTSERIEESESRNSTASLRRHAYSILEEIRKRISHITGGLTCSAGMANNFFLAKICADKNKPDGQFEIPPSRGAVLEFMESLPTRKVGGIGKVNEKILEKLGMRTMGDVRANIHKVLHAFTPKTGEFLARVSIGIGEEEGREEHGPSDTRSADATTSRKSLGCERTFPNLSSPTALLAKLRELCETVASELVEGELYCHTVTLKLKTSKFELHTRSASAKGSSYIQSADAIHDIAEPLLRRMLPIELRLMGVTASNFKSKVLPILPPGHVKISNFFTVSSSSSSSVAGLSADSSGSTEAGGTDYQLGEAEAVEDLDWHTTELYHEQKECDINHSVSNKCDRSEHAVLTEEDYATRGDLECPVCNNVRLSSLDDLNTHIDICLNAKFFMEEKIQNG